MGGLASWRGRPCPCVVGVSLVLVSVELSADERRPTGLCGDGSNVRIADRDTAATVRRTLKAASDRLGDPACQQVLSDFADRAGRSLSKVLEELGQTPDAYLGTRLFYDGSGAPTCARTQALAFTQPGSHAILICSQRFLKAGYPDAEMIMIHEMLHTLGLGENPPASQEISLRVLARCFTPKAHLSPSTR